MPSEMVERCARAAKDALLNDPETDAYMQRDDEPDDFLIDGRVRLTPVVRAVLEALREPTEEMADVAWEHLDWGPPGYEDAASGAASPEKAWSIMLDTALKDTSE